MVCFARVGPVVTTGQPCPLPLSHPKVNTQLLPGGHGLAQSCPWGHRVWDSLGPGVISPEVPGRQK